VGLGLIFKSRATSGGTDIVAMMVSKYTKLPVGQLLIVIDSVIVLLGLIVFRDWKIPLYSLIVIFIVGKVVDIMLEGMNYDKVLFIISQPEFPCLYSSSTALSALHKGYLSSARNFAKVDFPDPTFPVTTTTCGRLLAT
jgi:hypothetical protein